MKIDLNTWGPMTVLAVGVILLVVLGGLIVVIIGDMSFEAFTDKLILLAGLLGGGTAIGRGLRLQPTTTR